MVNVGSSKENLQESVLSYKLVLKFRLRPSSKYLELFDSPQIFND